jgi:hypothetical protein
MKLSSPKQITWWIALILIVLGVIASLVTVPVLSGIAIWVTAAGGVLLLIATTAKGI